MHRTVWKSLCPKPACELEAEDATDGAIHVADVTVPDLHRLLAVKRRRGAQHKLPVQDVSELMILRHATVHRSGLALCQHGLHCPGGPQQISKVQICCLPVVLQMSFGAKHVSAADQVIELADTQRSHDFPRVFGKHEEEVDEMLWLSSELLTELRILRRHAYRASVEMTFPHHNAAQRDERGRGHCNFLCTQQCRHDHVSARADLAICLQHHAVTQAIEHQRLVSFGHTHLPGQPAMLDGGPLCGAGTPRHARDCEVVSLAFDDA
mmetsp:Transcript_72577/g.168149  ORF Transcript_72577/g.168149 Transcript_72577/m.168149 type:complete len:266 (-) Transcript_72577:331-1128(-)